MSEVPLPKVPELTPWQLGEIDMRLASVEALLSVLLCGNETCEFTEVAALVRPCHKELSQVRKVLRGELAPETMDD